MPTPPEYRGVTSPDRALAAQVLAAHDDKWESYSRSRRRDVTEAVLAKAMKRVYHNMDTGKPTTIDYEIGWVAERHAKAVCRRRAAREEHKAKHGPEFLKAESKLKQGMRALRELFDIADGIDFDDDATEILTDTLGRLRALLDSGGRTL